MNAWLRHQLRLLLLAVQFYTRLPVPAWVGYSDELLNQATVYFPVVGWLVGGLTAAVYAGSRLLFHDDNVALLLSLGAGILLTGAFHEDGFADTCDGFGGGWTKLRILEIMKDSRLGTYGAVGLVLLLALKLAALRGLAPGGVGAALLVAHPLSRATALTCIFSHEYARENEDSKAKPVAKKIGRAALAVGLGWAAYRYWRTQAGRSARRCCWCYCPWPPPKPDWPATFSAGSGATPATVWALFSRWRRWWCICFCLP